MQEIVVVDLPMVRGLVAFGRGRSKRELESECAVVIREQKRSQKRVNV